MKPYSAPVNDILFSLNKVADAPSLPNWDNELNAEIVNHFAVFAQSEIAPLDEVGDTQGCRLEGGNVHMPDGFAQAFSKLKEGGWQGLSTPEEFGGMGQNKLVAAAVSEIFSGACHSMQMVCNLVPGAVTTLLRFGTQAQQELWIPRLSSGEALSTMCLTEPDAGSDLSKIRTKAVRTDNGWRVSGEKIFISGGDQNLSEDILHLVLARTSDDGIKGLSLFFCSKSEAAATIKIARIENKLGLHASPTCHMVFDEAPAQLVGEEGAGLTAMFTLMNHARIDVALQGVAHAARAYDICKSYTAQRAQGRKADGSKAMLIDHADVRRQLDMQRSLALGARAMAHITLMELERDGQSPLIDFLTPLCKVFCTQAGIHAADIGIQVLGGYGYLNEYRISQTWRDARITAIYEGANAIHEVATATRGLKSHGGAGADAFDELINRLAKSNHEVMYHLSAWRQARQAMLIMDDPSTRAHEFTKLTCDLFYRATWVKIAESSDVAEIDRLHTAAFEQWHYKS